MKRLICEVAMTMVLAGAVGLPCHGGPATLPGAQPVDDAIAHLADPDPAVRDRAARTLRDAGPAARTALELAANGDDPEIAGRAKRILGGISTEPVGKTAPEPELPEVTRYRESAPAAKRLVISELASNEANIRALTRLWTLETDADLRALIFEALLKQPSAATGALLGDGSAATAELLLQAAVDRREPEAPLAYATYWLCRGRIEDAIRRWSARGGQQPADTWAEQVLAQLYRAKGDATAAVTHARATGDADFLRETLLWAGDWRRLSADMHQNNAAAPPIADLRLQTGIDALAGDAKALDADVADLIARSPLAGEANLAARTMLLADRPEEAIKLLAETQQFGMAYELMIARSKYDDAAALLAEHDTDVTQEAMMLRCTAARCLARLGDKKQVAQLIDRILKENADSKFPRVYALLAEAERAAGMTDESWKHFADALDSAPGQSTHWYITRAFGQRELGLDWPALWYAAMRQNPNRPVRALFERMRSVYDRTMPIEDLTAVFNGLDLSDANNSAYIELVWEAARRMKEAGQEAQAVQFAERFAKGTTGGELYTHLGDWAAEKKEWARAAELYNTAWLKDRTKALPLYLRGWALVRTGQAAEGRERIQLAHVLPLADEAQREELIKGLSLRGLDEAAARESEILIRTGQPLSTATDVALRVSAEHLAEKQEFFTAHAQLQRSTLDFMNGNYGFLDEPMYLYLPNLVRRTRARALLAAGNWDAAQEQIKICDQALPGEIFVAIDLVPDLEKLGKRAEADALFDRTFAEQQAACARFPDSANAHNQIAWLAATCHRQLDLALEHAKRAVELDPKRTAYIDTLAEVYFQRGQYAQAIDEWKKCRELEPEVHRHRKQIERTEAAIKAKERP